MDTRFWGPSGWRMLHLIAADPTVPQRRAAVKEWFELLEFVLPCKYCRASFHDYMQAQPLTDEIMETPATFGRWMYEIHNRVNDKLRGQGLLTASNPSWPTVRDRYTAMQRGLCKGSPLLGWDFMTSIAFTTPAADYSPVPMPDAPEQHTDWADLDIGTRNRYNLLTRAERLRMLAAWWRLVPSILPCAEWRRAWAASLRARQPPLQAGREAVMRWMWKIEEHVCAGLQCPTPHASCKAMEREVSAFESQCSTAKKGKTCRTRRHRQRRHVHTRRMKKGVSVL
jgi:hypothetical protein